MKRFPCLLIMLSIGTAIITLLPLLIDGPRQALAVEGEEVTELLSVQAINDFATVLYRQIATDAKGDNMFFSPYSVFSALTMTAEGARGKTAQQMGTVLRFPEETLRTDADAEQQPWDMAQIQASMAKLNQHLLNEDGESSDYELRIANALWAEQTYLFRETFLETLHKAYHAAAFSADFVATPDQARMAINRWVEQQTNTRIKDLLPPGTVDAMTRLVLTNAIYFKGNWAEQFDRESTEEADFSRADGTQVKVPLMTALISKTRYAELLPDGTRNDPVFNRDRGEYELEPNPEGLQLLELPYRGDTLAMVILLPKQLAGLDTLEQQLTSSLLDQWLQTLQPHEVIVFLPKFRLETTYDLVATLRSMGMPAAFQPGGFTGMSDSPDADQLYLSNVAHKTFVEVNEEGTEAAAATGTTIALTSARIEPPNPVFLADRPFLFLVHDKETNSILFLGRMVNPEATP